MSLPRPPIPSAPGNLFLIHNLIWCLNLFHSVFFFFSSPPPSRGGMNRRLRIRHPVWFIWRTEISADAASQGECTLAVPRRKFMVWGKVVEGEGRLSARSCTAFTQPGNCENVPHHTHTHTNIPSWAVGPGCGALLAVIKCLRVMAQLEVGCVKLSRGVGLTGPQCVNLCPTVTSDPVTKVWRRGVAEAHRLVGENPQCNSL